MLILKCLVIKLGGKSVRNIKLKSKIFVLALLMMTSLMIVPSKASAYQDYTTPIPLVTVKDIGNVPYPSTTNLYFFWENYRNFSKFSIEDPGEVKAYFRWGAAVKGKGTVWFSRDSYGYDVVGDVITLSRNVNSITSYLDAGTYYINCVWDKEAYEVGAALLYENAKTEEQVPVSSFEKSNVIGMDRLTRGFLTHTSPYDYYVFSLEEKALLNVEFSFDKESMTTSSAEGICTIYNDSHIEVTDGKYQRRSQGVESLDVLLEPGTYYIRLTGTYGVTTLQLKPMYYRTSLIPDVTKGWTKGPMNVTIDTTIDYKELIVVAKKVHEDDIKDRDLWAKNTRTNELYIPSEGNKFEVLKNGYYTVRIEDKLGNLTLETIRVTTMDTTLPKVTGVKNNKSYKKAVTIKWSDSQSGINTKKVTLNKKKVKSGIKVTEPGKYTLKVYDKVGNVRTVVFYIDFTKPTIKGASNNRTYTGNVTLNFSDNLSGIKKITVNGNEIKANTKTYTCRGKGSYTVKVWDNAGNTRTTKFKIK